MASFSPARQHAIVIGGSMAGLLAARVLAKHFARVTIIERDSLPADTTYRAGVPQSRQLHVLLQRGQQLLEQYLPGFTSDLVAHGGQSYDFIEGTRLNAGFGWNPQYFGDVPFMSATRTLVEWVARQHVLALPQISTLPNHQVVDLVASAEKQRVTGVHVRARNDQADNPIAEILGDLVVDASGRHSRAPEWLRALGYAAPAETVIDPHLGYSSRLYRPKPGVTRPWKTLYLMMQPPKQLRGAVITTVENGDWMVCLCGYGANVPPTKENEFVAFAQSLPFPDAAEAIADAEPLTPIYGYRDTSNQLRAYAKLRALPDGFIVTGDAVVAFDPVYGQGMTTATIGADVLDRALARRRDPELHGFGHAFQQQLAKAVDPAWQLSSGADLAVPGVTGGKSSLMGTIQSSYLNRIYRLMGTHRRTRITFTRVVMMTQPPTALFHPAILLRAMTVRKQEDAAPR
jgi:2-polyprenyl-6-methoxyphenol hydroxylase-like FAD-dependent oxidoreductase